MHCPLERVIATHIVNALPHLPVAELPRLNSQLTFLSPSPAALCIVCALCIVSLVHCALSHLEERAANNFNALPLSPPTCHTQVNLFLFNLYT